MLKIEEGKYYRTRDGRKVGPMGKPYQSSTSDRMLVACLAFPSRGIWWSDGRGSTAYDTPEDLIAEWTDGPVVTETVTKTRIVPGVYDGVYVEGVIEIPDCDKHDEPPARSVLVAMGDTLGPTAYKPTNSTPPLPYCPHWPRGCVMLSYWWGVMAGAALVSQWVLFQHNTGLTVPPIYWIMGAVAFVGHVWLWWVREVSHD